MRKKKGTIKKGKAWQKPVISEEKVNLRSYKACTGLPIEECVRQWSKI